MLKKKLSFRSNTTVAADDDVDDDTFLQNSSRSKKPPISPAPHAKSSTSCESPNRVAFQHKYENLEQQRSQLCKQKLEIEDRMIESTQRSISLLRDSEEVGNATAEELLRQREQLQNTDYRLNEIGESLHNSQKHIQGISSIIGSIKNYWSNRKSSVAGKEEKVEKSPRSTSLDATPRTRRVLQNALDRANTNVDAEDHPALLLRGLSSQGSSQSKSSRDSSVDAQELLDRNLDEMSGSIARLKGLAQGLGQELDSQNYLLEDVITKTEKADINIERQNKDINRILKK